MPCPRVVVRPRRRIRWRARSGTGPRGRLFVAGACDAIDSGDGRNIAQQRPPSPIVLDVDAATLEGFALPDLTAYPAGEGAVTAFGREIAFYDAPF